MKALDKAIRKTQAWWGVDRNTAETMVLFVATKQLICDDSEYLLAALHRQFPDLLSLRSIRCIVCDQVIVFFPTDGTIAVRDDGELICLDCKTNGSQYHDQNM